MRILCAASALGLVVCLTSVLAAPEGRAQPASSATPKADAPKSAAAAPKADAPKADGPRADAPKHDAKGDKPGPRAQAKKPAASSKAATKAPAKKGGKKPLARKPGSEPGEADEATRRIIAGTAPGGGKAPGRGAESPELRAMRDLDLALFPSSRPSSGSPWPTDTLPPNAGEPRLLTSGMPPSAELPAPPSAQPAADLSWLRQLNMPDIPVRWDARVVRYLEFYKNNPRGRSMVAGWIKKSGRYAAAVHRVLRDQNMPEDILWLALVESGFDPTIVSPAGAAGLWQFMPDGARIYGLTIDRWVDERLDPERATLAAAKYLADLRTRFGGWELAFAAYNMGYGGLLASIRKYNTNDYWELARFEAGIPFETALYVPKIVAMAIVARNKAVFGCADVELEPAIEFDKVAVGSGVQVKTIAAASGVPEARIAELNPQLLALRTPPLAPSAKQEVSWVVRVPAGAGARAANSLPKLAADEPKVERYQVRWGESLDDVASLRGTTRSALASLNGLRKEEVVRPGTVLLVPASPGIGAAAAASLVAVGPKARPVVVVPSQSFPYADRRRVFYRVVAGDTLHDIANAFAVSPDELCRWNLLDPTASLHEGMTLQLYVGRSQTFSGATALEERDARLLSAGSPEFFAYFEGQKGRARIEVAAQPGDTWKSVARRYGLSIGLIERINQKPRSSPLAAGEKVVVYVPAPHTGPALAPDTAPADERSDVAVAASAPAGEDPVRDDEVKPATLPASQESDAPAKKPPPSL